MKTNSVKFLAFLLLVFVFNSCDKKEDTANTPSVSEQITKNWSLYKYSSSPGGIMTNSSGTNLNLKSGGTFTCSLPFFTFTSGTWSLASNNTKLVITGGGSSYAYDIEELGTELKLHDQNGDGKTDNYVMYFK